MLGMKQVHTYGLAQVYKQSISTLHIQFEGIFVFQSTRKETPLYLRHI